MKKLIWVLVLSLAFSSCVRKKKTIIPTFGGIAGTEDEAKKVDPGTGTQPSSKPDGITKVGDKIIVQVTFSEAVNVDGSPEVVLSDGTKVKYVSGSGSNILVFEYTIPDGKIPDDINYKGSDALQGGTITLASTGTPANVTLPSPNQDTSLKGPSPIYVDTTGPKVTNVTSSNANGTYKVGDKITLVVTMSEVVIINGIPELILNNGGVAKYVSGSGSDTLTFEYIVGPTDKPVADLSYKDENSLTVAEGATIKDASNNDANRALPPVGATPSLVANKDIVIEGPAAAPKVTNVSAPNGTYKIGDTVTITVTFDQSLAVTGNPTLTLGNGATATCELGNPNTTLTCKYVVKAGDKSSADLNYVDSNSLVLGDATIKSASSGVAADKTLPDPTNTGTTTTLAKTSDVVIDAQGPKVASIVPYNTPDNVYGPGMVVSFKVTMDEPVVITGGNLL